MTVDTRQSTAARRNEELVLAESALLGERTVSVVRVVLMMLLGLVMDVVARLMGQRVEPDPWRALAIVLYLSFALGAFVMLRRLRPDPRWARLAPLVATPVDFGFFAFMAIRSFRLEARFYPEMAAASCAMLLCFSVARYSWLHVLYSTALACLSFVVMAGTAGVLAPVPTGFVIGVLVALGLLVGFTNQRVRRMFVELRRRDNLSRFLPPAVVERVLRQGDGALAPMMREVTVLFTDIRDFTALSESLPPAAVLELLDHYHGHMADVVKAHDGIVNKFLGDGMLAVWNVPDDNPAHAERALQAALAMRLRLRELNGARAASGQAPIRIGIGIHTGAVAAGMLGGADQHEYTVIGDAVNVASRVEGLTKTLGVDILVTESAWRAAGARFAGERVSEEPVRGRQAPVVVYALR